MWRYALPGIVMVAIVVGALAGALDLSTPRPALSPPAVVRQAARQPPVPHPPVSQPAKPPPTTPPPTTSQSGTSQSAMLMPEVRVVLRPGSGVPAPPGPPPHPAVAAAAAPPAASPAPPAVAPPVGPVQASAGADATDAANRKALAAKMQALAAQVAMMNQTLAQLRAQGPAAPPEPGGRAPPGPSRAAASTAAPTPAPTVAPAPAAVPAKADFAAVQNLLTHWRRAGGPRPASGAAGAPPRRPAQPPRYWFATAHRDLAIGDVAGARQIIEALLTEQVLRPPGAAPDPAEAAVTGRLNQALGYLNAGDIAWAAWAVDDAAARLGAAGAGPGAGGAP